MMTPLWYISKEYNQYTVVLWSIHFYCQYRSEWLNYSLLDKLKKDVLSLRRHISSLPIFQEKYELNKKICLKQLYFK